ncbi:MAG: PAS domain S-box protein [Chlorobiaceae bacterium]|nr:PAS domain S-box protein [Chlorobiaceae bacterium]
MPERNEHELQRLQDELDAAKSRIQELDAELGNARALLKVVMDVTPDFLLLKDRDSVYRLVNPAFCRFLGKSEEEIIGKGDYDLFPPEDAAVYVSGDSKVMRTLEPEVEDRNVTGENGRMWLHMIKTPVLDSTGAVTGLLCSVRDISRRKKIELEFERFFNLMPDMVCVASCNGFFTKVNAAWQKCLGYSEKELLAVPYLDLVHPNDRASTREEVARQLAGKGMNNFINRYRAKDGSYRWLEWNSTPVEENVLYAVARDISDRMGRERETRLWADAFRFCAHGIAIGLPLTNEVLTCNEAFARMHGQVVPEIEGSPILSMYVPEDRELVVGHLKEADRTGFASYQARMMRKNGTSFPVQMDVVSVSDEDGHLLYRIATMQDITERVAWQTALQESEERFRSVVESAPDAIIIQTAGRFAYVNQSAMHLFGASSAEEIVGREVLEMIHPDFRGMVAERIREINESHLPQSAIDNRVLRIDGTSVDVEASGVPFMYAGRSGALVFMRDVSARKMAEKERTELEIQLFQSQKIESIGRLAGGVAHDLNNLLTPILGYSEMLSSRFPESDRRRQHIEVIHDAALKSRELVRQLLAFSSRQALDFRLIDLNSVIRGFQKLLRRTIRANVDIQYRLYDGALAMMGDASQLEQIIMNLAINAEDAMPSGGELVMETSITVIEKGQEKFFEGLSSGRYATLSVRDTGFGMDKETLSHMFEPFYTTKPKGKGTGLGLSTVYGIARQHGGIVKAESETGGGTCFRLCFPLQQIAVQPLPLQEVPPPQHGNGATILVVEDDEMVRKFVVQALTEDGFTICDASGSEEAIELLEQGVCMPDLLLTDLVMRGMNGKELYDKVKVMIPSIRVIYMSGYTKNIITSHGVFNEGISFLQKPFSVQALEAKVREILGS